MEQILSANSAAKVLILTTFGEEQYIDRAMSAGASGFLLKNSGPEELIGAVHAVAEGAAALSPRIAKRVIDKGRSIDMGSVIHAQALIRDLSVREHDVLSLVGTGLANAEIAAQLHLTEATVKGHMTSIMLKIGARTRVQAALIAYQSGMVGWNRS